MKIKRLEIKNIASIEDAVIDFDKKPLSGTDLFLITGTTGSGKTTLLDAICLALYNTTPRISKGKKENFDVNRDGLTEKDPRNILRQDTGYGYSRLYFTGNNNHEYYAEWSVERGTKRKVQSSLSRAVWTITDRTTGISVTGDKTETYKEVREVIQNAVGLDFEQFGRTTMLAQGEFTEFLKSDEAEKAEILEKISGSEIYRRIGIAIYNKTAEAKKLFDAEAAKHAQIVTMSDEDRQMVETQAQEAAKESESCQNRVNELNDCINWLNERARLEEKVQTAKAQFDNAAAITSSEDFQSRSLRIKQWNETIDVRMQMNAAAEGKRKAEKAAAALAVLRKEFGRVLSGREAQKEELQVLMRIKDELEERINGQSAYADAYGSHQSIIAAIKNMTDEKEKAADKRLKLQEAKEKKLPEAEKLLELSHAAETEASAEYTAVKKLLNEVNRKIADLKLPESREEKEFLKELESIKTSIVNVTSKITSTAESIAQYEADLKTCKDEEEREKKELVRLKAEHERRKQTVDRFAKEMRSHLNLHIGTEDNLCPVCGHLVSAPVNDALIDDEYRKIKEEYEEQERKVAAATDKVNKTDALIKVVKNRLGELQKEHERYSLKLTEATSSRADADELLQCSPEELAERIEGISARITEGEKTEDEQKKIRKKHDDLLMKKHEAEKDSERKRLAVENVKAEILRLSGEIVETEGKIKHITESIGTMLSGATSWDNDWMVEPKAFATELEEKAKAYDADKSALANAKADIRRISSGMEIMDSALHDISVLMPDWEEPAITACHMNDLQTSCVRLTGDVKGLKTALTSAEREHDKAKAEVEAFLESNPAYTMEILESLDHITQTTCQRETLYINSVSSQMLLSKREYEIAVEESEKHLEDRPELLDDNMTVDTLTADKEEQEKRRNDCNQRMGELHLKLEADDKARVLKHDTKRLDELAEIYQKWHGFCKYFGDSEGKTLSKIAQSFVLSSLLDAANHHLHNMDPRYRLLVNPGSLNLKLEDKYNGYSTRGTNSISGGESFLVSLALALALADFGQHLGVSTLFIDEGFGTLSGKPLQNAINTLKSLHGKAGRQVGIISHREEIRASIPVQIKVNLAEGKSSSTIEVTDK